MSKALNRPMFRKGGPVDGRGTGITSGLDTPKRGMVDEPGKYSQDANMNLDPIGLINRLRTEAAQNIPMPKPEFTVSDFLRLAGRGFELAGAPSQGKGIKGLIATASPTLGKIGVDVAGSLDKRMATAKQRRDKQISDTVTTGAALEVAKIKANRPFETQLAADKVADFYNKQIETTEDESRKKELQELRDNKIINIYTKNNLSRALGGIYSTQNIEEATELAIRQLKKGKPDSYNPTLEEIQPIVSRYLKGLQQAAESQSLFDDEDKIEKKALGGMTGEGTEQEKPMPLTYDELKARLKGQVSDDIVKLLSQSYEALADFAQITTQADVNSFNQKYQVELVLPQTQES